MFNQFFGQFLLQRELLTPQQLCAIFEKESSARVKLGMLAIDKSLMTPDQVEEVHRLQKVMDKRFGEVAILKGYLSPAQVESLLQTQSMRHLSLSQAILEHGYLSLGQLTAALEEYKNASVISGAKSADDFDEIAWLLLDFKDSTEEQKELYYTYAGLFLRNIVRFLQASPVLAGSDEAFAGQTQGWAVSQIIEMDGRKLLTGLVLSEDALITLASRYSGELLTTANPLALDSTAEFLNVHNGTFSINLSNTGNDVIMLPQKIEQSPYYAVHRGYSVSVVVPFGQIQLLIAEPAE